MLAAVISFTQKILSAELVLYCTTLHLFNLQISFITIPREAGRGKFWGGTSIPASKRTSQASVLSVRCLQLNERKPRDKIRIHLDCSTTHGRAKLVPHWIPQFRHIFTSSASSKTKTDKKFSCVSVRRWRRTKAKLVNWQQKLTIAIKTTVSRTVRLHVSFVQLKLHRNSHYTWQLAVNFN